MAKITVQNTEITIVSHNDDDYISLTDMARSQLQEHIIFRWLSLKSTIEYLGEWEMLYNPNFNCTEFGTFSNMAGSNNFVLSVKASSILNSSIPSRLRPRGFYITLEIIIFALGFQIELVEFFANFVLLKCPFVLDWYG